MYLCISVFVLDTALRAKVLANKHERKCLKAFECSVDLLDKNMYSIPCLQITWLELDGELGNTAWLQSDDDDGGGWNRISSESKVAT